MLSVWWDYKSVVYFELLPRNQTINSDVHCQQLMKLDETIKEKWPELANRKGIVFHHTMQGLTHFWYSWEIIGA